MSPVRAVFYYADRDEKAAIRLATALGDVLPDAIVEAKSGFGPGTLFICPY